MIQNNIKSIREQFQKNGVFHTPPETIAKFSEKLFFYLPKEKIHEVYDPTCGVGGLYTIFGDEVKKYGQELDENFLAYCRENTPNFEWYAGDTLEQDFFEGKKFQCVIANPPFSVEWKPENHENNPKFCKIFDKKWKPVLPPKSKADYAFMLHIIDKMADADGVALVVMFPGILYRGNSEGKIRTWLLDQNLIEEIFEIPSGSFVDTNIATIGLILRKNKTHHNIVFTGMTRQADGSEKIQSITISREQIQKDHDDNLSISSYLQHQDPELEKPDSAEIYKLMYNNFVNNIILQKSIMELFGDGKDEFWEFIMKCKIFIDEMLETKNSIQNN